MKKVLVFAMSLLLAASIAPTARADAIASPSNMAADAAAAFLPWILVGAAVGVTACLLRKYWKKKK